MMHGKNLTGYSIRKEINVFQKNVVKKNNIVTRFEQSTHESTVSMFLRRSACLHQRNTAVTLIGVRLTNKRHSTNLAKE
jgi:hypothetical protein